MEAEQPFNPYASPTAEEAPSEVEQLKDKRLIILPPVCELPRRCVFCNQPATKSHRLRYRWWLYFWGVFSISIKWYACELHDVQVRRQQRSWWNWLVWFAGFIVVANGIDYLPAGVSGFLGAYGFGVAIALVLVAHYWSRRREHEVLTLPTVDRAEPDAVAFKHAGRPFLDSLADGAEGYLVVDKIP
ncbi:hypothetical protein Pla123a_04280 [Posidoniimonas polymericola]|uniref:Uncharacterized protein n=1 Tax=Posidoniimonas polymericola TaxID=2528002 RepID=A0A5C5ZFJ8_9BACT|nr:hypothetical protein [Posidoniimonas polymericola]TWT85621.1 hypothetical protein Pla123a_04280 [Posidoniimonas polymericola]